MCTRMTQKCDMVNEQVCQQVPMRVPVPGKKMVPQPPRWEMKCEDITEVSRPVTNTIIVLPYHLGDKVNRAGRVPTVAKERFKRF